MRHAATISAPHPKEHELANKGFGTSNKKAKILAVQEPVEEKADD